MNNRLKHNGILLEVILAILRVSKKELADRLKCVPPLISRYLTEETFSSERRQQISKALDLNEGIFDLPVPTIDDLMKIVQRTPSPYPVNSEVSEGKVGYSDAVDKNGNDSRVVELLEQQLAMQADTIKAQWLLIERMRKDS